MRFKLIGFCTTFFYLVFFAGCTPTASEDAETTESASETSETSEEGSEDETSTDETANSSTTDGTTTSTGALAISTDTISVAYPEGLTVTAFPTEAADTEVVSGTLAIGTTLTLTGLALNDPHLDPDPNHNDPNHNQNHNVHNHNQNHNQNHQNVGSNNIQTNGGGSQCSGPTETKDRLWFDIESETYTNISEVFAYYEAQDQKAPIINPTTVCQENQRGPLDLNAFNPNKKSASQKLIAEQEILQGKAENCFSPDVFEALQFESGNADSCFEFDHGIMSGKSCDSEEACLVSYSRGLVESASAKVEGGLGLLQALICVAKKEGFEDLPENGKTLDLTEAIKSRTPSNSKAPTFSKAEISRSDSDDGSLNFITTIEIALPDGRASSYNLSHSPSAEKGNEEYSGIFWFSRGTGQNPEDTNCEQGEPQPQEPGLGLGTFQPESLALNAQAVPQEFQRFNPPIANCILGKLGKDVTSVRYERAGTGEDTRVKMEIREARINVNQDTDPFTEEGLVNYNANANMTSTDPNQLGSFPWEANAYIGQISYIAFDMNPVTSEGSLSFWKNPGGNYSESARGFIFEVNYDDETGLLNGCGIAGAALEANQSSIRQATFAGIDLEPTGLYTPMVCWSDGNNGQGDNISSRVWKQCFSQNSEGVYEIDTTQTTSEKGYDIIGVADVRIKGPQASQIKKRQVR